MDCWPRSATDMMTVGTDITTGTAMGMDTIELPKKIAVRIALICAKMKFA
jgi:hypothetical protein